MSLSHVEVPLQQGYQIYTEINCLSWTFFGDQILYPLNGGVPWIEVFHSNEIFNRSTKSFKYEWNKYIRARFLERWFSLTHGLSKVWRTVFTSKNMQLEVTKYCSAFTTRYSNDNTKCYPEQCIGMSSTKTEQYFNPGLTLISLSETGPIDKFNERCLYFHSFWKFTESVLP